MRWGIVGAGLHAEQRIVPAFAKTKAERLHGVVGSSEAAATAFSQRVGSPRVYASIEALAADPAIDAVFITTPNDQHRRQTEIVAAAGKHVLVEKPMALSEADCRAMIDAAQKARVRLGVGFQARHHPVHRAIRELVAAGELGDVVLVRGEWHSSYGPWKNWRADPRRAGSDVLGAIGVHVLDLMCWLAGAEVRDVSALVDRCGRDRTGPDDRLHARLLERRDRYRDLHPALDVAAQQHQRLGHERHRERGRDAGHESIRPAATDHRAAGGRRDVSRAGSLRGAVRGVRRSGGARRRAERVGDGRTEVGADRREDPGRHRLASRYAPHRHLPMTQPYDLLLGGATPVSGDAVVRDGSRAVQGDRIASFCNPAAGRLVPTPARLP